MTQTHQLPAGQTDACDLQPACSRMFPAGNRVEVCPSQSTLCILSMSASSWPEAVNCLRERPSAEEVEEVLGSHSGSYQSVEKGHLITRANAGRSCAAVFSLSSGMPDARVLSWLPKQLISWKSLAFCQQRKQLARIASETELGSICSQLKSVPK